MNLLRICGWVTVFFGWLLIFSFMMLMMYLTGSMGIGFLAILVTLVAAVYGYMQDKYFKKI